MNTYVSSVLYGFSGLLLSVIVSTAGGADLSLRSDSAGRNFSSCQTDIS